MSTADTIHQLKLEIWNLSYMQWKTQVLFSAKWWGLIALIGISYIIWWIVVDKRRLSEILLFGSFIAVGRIVMDIIGNDAVLWSYDVRETPFVPSPFLHDYTLTPLALMVVYQFCHSWSKFLVWTTIIVGIISFVFFPVLELLHFLTLYKWKLFYSFVLIIAIAFMARLVLLGVLNIEQNYEYEKDLASKRKYKTVPVMKLLDEHNDGEK